MNINKLARLAHPFRRNEKGLSIVESALVLPLVMLIILGILEGALLFRTYLTAGNSASGGARIGSIDGQNTYSDYDILQGVAKGATGADTKQILEVIVYKGASAGAGPTQDCINSAESHTDVGITGLCNVYVGSDISRPETDFGPKGTGADQYWPAITRNLSLSAGSDFLGVWVHIQCQCMSTTLFGINSDLHASSVIQLEASEA